MRVKGWETPLNNNGVSKENLPPELNDYIKFLEDNLVFPLPWFRRVLTARRRFTGS